MQEATHRMITRAAIEAAYGAGWRKVLSEMGMDATDTGTPDQFAAAPDLARDIHIAGIGYFIFGHNLASLTHFNVPIAGEGRCMGYSWGREPGLPDLPNVAPLVDSSWWMREGGVTWKARHPMAEILSKVGGTDAGAADEVTYASARSMIIWCMGWRPASAAKAAHSRSFAAGCICHWLQDKEQHHHRVGWMFGGHQESEAEIAYEAKAILPKLAKHAKTYELAGPVTICNEDNGPPGACGSKAAKVTIVASYRSTVRFLLWLREVLLEGTSGLWSPK